MERVDACWTITSVLRPGEPPSLVSWSGKTLGIGTIHVYRLTEEGGKTIVTSEESWDGLIVKALRGRMKKTLEAAIESGLPHLKAASEQRALSTTTSAVWIPADVTPDLRTVCCRARSGVE
jgi:hypothetical protein